MVKFSVIVPVYNAEKFIEKCIRSVLEQDYENFELLLIDDESPDNSGKICDEWAKKDSRIRVIHKQNGGVSSARNEGIKQAKGQYIIFIDSDDYIFQGLLSFCNQKIQQLKNVDYFNYFAEENFEEKVKNSPRILPETYKDFATEKQKYKFLKFLLNKRYFNTVCWRSCYNVEFLRKNNLYFNENFAIAEDVLFNFFVFFASEKYIETSFLGVSHLQWPGSTCHTVVDRIRINQMIDFSEIVLEEIYARDLKIFKKNFHVIFHYAVGYVGQAYVDVSTDEKTKDLLKFYKIEYKRDFYMYYMKKALKNPPKIEFNEFRPYDYLPYKRKRALEYYSVNENLTSFKLRLFFARKGKPFVKFWTRVKRRVKGVFKKK